MVHFVGAGPGAPDLITLRGAELLKQADVIIYAGSLVNPALLELARADCEVHNSAEMTLEQVIGVVPVRNGPAGSADGQGCCAGESRFPGADGAVRGVRPVRRPAGGSGPAAFAGGDGGLGVLCRRAAGGGRRLLAGHHLDGPRGGPAAGG